MTAPDDVRVRFEVAAWQRRIKPDSGKWLAWEYFAGAVDYDNDRARFPDRVGRWECEYRPLYTHAAHSGEVRELVEASTELRQRQRDYLQATRRERNGAVGHLVGVAGERLDAALAKFHPTHQEKP